MHHSLPYYTAMQRTEYNAKIEGQFVFPIFGQNIYHNFKILLLLGIRIRGIDWDHS